MADRNRVPPSLLTSATPPAPNLRPGQVASGEHEHAMPAPTRVPAWVRLMRPHQWAKNLIVLAPLLFAGLFLEPMAVAHALLGAAVFSLAASAGYVYNDLQDIQADRRHPVKRHTRPLAAGEVSEAGGWTLLAALTGALLGTVWFLPWTVSAAVGTYLLIGVLYSSHLKEVPVVDLFALSAGFVLRVFVGAEAIGVGLSLWMAVTTLCLALYLGSVKRLAELEANGSEARSVLGEYDHRTLIGFALVSAVSALVFYALYTATMRPALAATIPLVIFGLFRYWYLVAAQGNGSTPLSDALSDRTMLTVGALWTASATYILWPA